LKHTKSKHVLFVLLKVNQPYPSTMTILGVPDGSGFSIGTSANIAPSSGDAIDMSLGT
jgi:hypothetical protein